MGPEDNPADDVQPTQEEWEEYERQAALDLHNAEYDRWQGMTDRERDDEIRRAMDNG